MSRKIGDRGDNRFTEKVMSPTEAAYFAGIVDGEGTIGLYKAKRPASRGGFRLMPAFRVSNTCFTLLERLRDMCGNGSIRLSNTNLPHHKLGYVLDFASEQMRHILPQIEPFLIVKSEQARIMLEFMAETKYGRNAGQGPDGRFRAKEDSSFDRTVHFADRIRELNRRGKAVVNA